MLEHTAAAKRFYQTTAWKKCRESYISSVYGLCERCGEPGSIVHHKIYINSKNINDPNITLNHDNLEYLCINDHNTEHHRKYSALREGFGFDDNGDLIEFK